MRGTDHRIGASALAAVAMEWRTRQLATRFGFGARLTRAGNSWSSNCWLPVGQSDAVAIRCGPMSHHKMILKCSALLHRLVANVFDLPQHTATIQVTCPASGACNGPDLSRRMVQRSVQGSCWGAASRQTLASSQARSLPNAMLASPHPQPQERRTACGPPGSTHLMLHTVASGHQAVKAFLEEQGMSTDIA